MKASCTCLLLYFKKQPKNILNTFNWWMDKQSVLYRYYRILFSNKKEENTDTCSNMDKWQMLCWMKAAWLKAYFVYESIYTTLKKRQNYRNSKSQSVGNRNWGLELVCLKRAWRNSYVMRLFYILIVVLYLTQSICQTTIKRIIFTVHKFWFNKPDINNMIILLL